MNELSNIKDFELFIDGIQMMNESLTDGSQSLCNRVFLEGKPIVFSDGSSVTPKEIVKVFDDAVIYLSDQFTRTFRFAKAINVIFLRSSNEIKTMAVDQNLNLYMNAGYIYHVLKMDPKLVAAVLMHEVFHILFNHIERGKNWLASKGMSVNNQTHHDNNLAADVEVNQAIIKIGLIDEDTLKNTVHAVFLSNKDQNARGRGTTILPMEAVLENEELMNKLRSICPPTPDPTQSEQKEENTSEEWNQGYIDGWNKLAEIIKKYGYKEAWNKLIEAGIINGNGEIEADTEIKDFNKLKMMTVKNYDEFINESNEVEENDDITKNDDYQKGYGASVGIIINTLKKAINGGSGGSGGGTGGGSKGPKTELDRKKLKPIDIPSNDQGEESSEGGDGENQPPTNFRNKDKKGKKGSSSGGEGKSDDEITEDDIDTLKNDLKKKSQNRGKGNSGEGDNGDGSSQSGSNDGSDDSNGSSQSGEDSQEKSSDKGNDEEQSGGSEKTDDGKSSKGKSSGKGGGRTTELGKNGKGNVSSSEDDSIGGTGSFAEEEMNTERILKDAGYDDEQIKKLKDVIQKNKEKNNPKAIEKLKSDMRNRLRSGDPIAKYLSDIEVSSEKYKNIWKSVMEKFLAKETRRAGTDSKNTDINWKRKSRIALGEVGPQYNTSAQEPQDINMYVDVSGSMDLELLEVISKSIVILCKEYEYSGINICPWASTSNGVYPVDKIGEAGDNVVVDQILGFISKGAAQCGGGTSGDAMIEAMATCMSEALDDPLKAEMKDDVHVVITDGEFDYNNIESRIRGMVKNALNRADTADKCLSNTVWMIYDMNDEEKRKLWKKEIENGIILFINSSVVKGNG